MLPHGGRQLSWYFGDSSHGDGLTEGLDGLQQRVRLGIGYLRHENVPRFRALHYRGKTLLPALLFIDMLEQSNKATTYDSRVASSRQNSNAVVEIYHEGKTPGSVLCGPVYAHGGALLVCIRVYDTKKNPGGRTG
jgi:hypothetical protein